ncbi:serine protease filzig [Galleria mellonella]|uniref:Serine protease filzig n=1 Tax=Galleria mellonella TaxID=7137 RepID=A0A6J1WKT0_GALME|nr:serine protease filzig [Galleria mellonella]
MTVRVWFKFGIIRSDVKQLVLLFVLLSILDNFPLICKGEDYDRDSSKLFGGYRITPTYCKATRTAKYNRGNTICMFNHECMQRKGEVVGACMDGFLFGACCQLKSDSQSHIPKGPGVVMTSYLDYPDLESETADYEAEQLNAWHNSFKPVVTPGYKPDRNQVSSTTSPEDKVSETQELISEGFNQITNTLLNSPPKDDIYIKPERPGGIYTHSTIDHNIADTILFHKNGSIADNIARPSDFNIQISSMQTKPTYSPISTSTSPPKTVSTHLPIYPKPVFKPKPAKKNTTQSSTENYVIVSTVTKENQKITELSSINSIIQMLNDSTPSLKEDTTSPSSDILENKSSPSPTYNYYVSPGHFVTVRPGASVYSTTFAYSTKKPYTTKKPYFTTPNSIPEVDKPTTKPQYSSPIPSLSTSQALEAFNNYPTDPNNFGQSLTTFSYVSSTTTHRPTTTTRKPPSTSYVTGSSPLRRPVTSPSSIISSYDAGDTFSSVTPTVIVLHGLHTPKPETSTEEKEPEFVEISQEPFKKPISQITVNNHIESTNNIFVGKPPQKYDRPSSPTVLITPKPTPNTTPYPVKGTTRPVSITSPAFDSYTEYYSPTTLRPELQTSPDDLINFPPVRNPMLNATGSNPLIYNTSITLSNDEIENIPDIDFTTPSWQEDENLNEKMNLFVNKIVGSLQGTFQELHDIVILDKKTNITSVNTKTTTPKTIKKTPATTRKPVRVTTTKKPTRLTTTTRKPVRTTKKPTKLTTAARRTTTIAPQTTTTAKKPATTTKKTKPTRKATTTIPTTTFTEQSEELTTEPYRDTTIDYNDKNLCGVRPLVKSGRIVGGKNAEFGEWPWQVLVRESTWLGLFTKNKCGGVLITNKFVTTAAHCQPGFLASLVAVFGENDISGDKEPRRPVSKNVRRVIVHRQYDAATFENDLALLELETPVKFDAHIVPICMPPDDADFTGRMATVTGWGRLKYGGGVPTVLQEVQVPVIENSACQEMFLTAGHFKNILKSFICAGYANGEKDSCEGDSGGPLVLQREDGRWQLVGTVSHGIKCAAPYLPGVYMRTTFYKPWLKSVTGVH